MPPDGVDVDTVVAGLSDACSAVLGYEQPVEEKPLGADVSDSESEDE